MTSTAVPRPRKAAHDADANWALLERIAASPHLKRATRLQELLFYIAKCSLKEGYGKISEQKIGVDVFGRPEGYDTSADNIVRTSVSELRKRIDAYFESEGSDESLIMEIPRWSYIPSFMPRHTATQPSIERPISGSVPPLGIVRSGVDAVRSPRPQRWVPITLTALCLLTIALAGASVFFWQRYRALNGALYPWHSEPSVSALWTNILNANPNTDVILADASFGLVQELDKKSFSFDDYLNRSYINQLQVQRPRPEMESVLNRIVLWNMGSQDDFKLARRILALDPLRKRIHLYDSRDYMPDLTARDSLILIGGRISNPWDDLFEGRMNFAVNFDKDGSITVVNRAPAAGERHIYAQEDSVQYCVVAYLPNPNHNGVVMLIEGTRAEATEAAGNFLFSENQLSNFKRTLHASRFPYFEALLKVSSVQGTPLTASVEAYRAYPNLR